MVVGREKSSKQVLPNMSSGLPETFLKSICVNHVDRLLVTSFDDGFFKWKKVPAFDYRFFFQEKEEYFMTLFNEKSRVSNLNRSELVR